MNDDCVYLTESCIIRGLSKKQYNVLCDISLRLNELRNCAVESTECVKSSDGIHFRKVNYKSVISIVRNEFKDIYEGVQDYIADETIKKHVDSFNVYITLRNKKIDQEYNQSLHKPKKHDNTRLSNIIIPGQSITCSKKKLSEGYIELPLSREYKKQLESKNYRPKIKIPKNIINKKLIQVEIIPIRNGKMFKANFTYQEDKESNRDI